MEVVFKDDKWIYYIDNVLRIGFISFFDEYDLSNIKHLDEVNPIYHYKDKENNKVYSVYFEYNDRFVTKKNKSYELNFIHPRLIKDYTIVNLNLI